MNQQYATLREHAKSIWQSAVDAVNPSTLIQNFFESSKWEQDLAKAPRIIVIGAGKAGAAMAAAVEAQFAGDLEALAGTVNVPRPAPGSTNATTKRIQLHFARPAAVNEPTEEGVTGAKKILELLSTAGPDDVALCLLSGGGSALLPLPVAGVTLADKQTVTRLLHRCGATINELNAVRKHLSRIKGGRLAQAFTGRVLHSLIISDVIGDPLDVIASGPTAADTSTFADAWQVLEKYKLLDETPTAVLQHLQAGTNGEHPETLSTLTGNVHNHILGNNAMALRAAQAKAKELGYAVVNLGSYIEGETRDVAAVFAGVIQSCERDGVPLEPPACILSGGETTVTLVKDHGKGGRNQEFALAVLCHLGESISNNVCVLCGGTDGEDGPTNAAGAFADRQILNKTRKLGLDPTNFLTRNDAWSFFTKTGGLLKTGLTQTNVMDVRVTLVGNPGPD